MNNKTYQPTEEQDCYVLARYLKILQDQGKIQMFTHIPNSTYTTSIKTKVRNKNLGVSRGVPDYMILTNKKILWIEMKRKTGSSTREEQYAWQTALNDAGCVSEICFGAESAIEIVKENL